MITCFNPIHSSPCEDAINCAECQEKCDTIWWREFCEGCKAEITEVDINVGRCTQCKEPIK